MTGHCGADNGLKALPWASRYLPDGRFRADGYRPRVRSTIPGIRATTDRRRRRRRPLRAGAAVQAGSGSGSRTGSRRRTGADRVRRSWPHRRRPFRSPGARPARAPAGRPGSARSCRRSPPPRGQCRSWRRPASLAAAARSPPVRPASRPAATRRADRRPGSSLRARRRQRRGPHVRTRPVRAGSRLKCRPAERRARVPRRSRPAPRPCSGTGSPGRSTDPNTCAPARARAEPGPWPPIPTRRPRASGCRPGSRASGSAAHNRRQRRSAPDHPIGPRMLLDRAARLDTPIRGRSRSLASGQWSRPI